MGRVATIGPIAVFLLALALTPPAREASGLAVVSPSCLDGQRDAAETYREEPVRIERGEVALAGRLFLPRAPGPHPVVVLLHGGGLERLNQAPLFFAPLLARCGVAALVYDKRGTGESGGVWETALFDDFVADAAAAVEMLARREDIDARRIGVIGFSQGGRLAPVVAVRYGRVAFVVSISGPFTSLIETRLYALDQRLRRWSLSGAVLDSTMALWRKHFQAVAAGDTAALAALDEGIGKSARRYGVSTLPPPSSRLPRTPFYNSIDRDYTAEIRSLRVPMLAVYGDRDAVVPVERSVKALQRVLYQGGHRDLDVQIIPFADHSFVDWTFNQRIKIEETVIDWVIEHLGEIPSDTSQDGATQRR